MTNEGLREEANQVERTRRSTAPRKLGESELRLHSLFDLAPEGIFEAHLSGFYTDVNQRGCEMLGYARHEIVGKPIKNFLRPEDVSRLEEFFREHAQGDQILASEWLLVRKDGSLLPVEVHARTLPNERVYAFVRDITDRKRAEQALSASERKFRTLVETAYDPILVTDQNGIIQLVNEQLQDIFGYTAQELLGKPVEVLLPERFCLVHLAKRQDYLARPERRPMGAKRELYARRKDGTEFPVDIALSPIYSMDGLQVAAIVRDMTEQKKNHDRQSFLLEMGQVLNSTMDYHERLKRVAQLLVPRIADLCVVRTIEDSAPVFRTAAARTPTEREELESLATPAMGITGPLTISSVLSSQQTLLVRDTQKEVLESPQTSPSLRQAISKMGIRSYLVVPMKASGKMVGALSLSLTDPTREFLEDDIAYIELLANRCAVAIENARLYRDAKLAILARESVLSIISHDLRTPVSTIKMAAELLMKDGLTEFSPKVLGGLLQNASEGILRLLSDLLDFGKIGAGVFTIEPRTSAVNEIVRRALESLRLKAQEKGVTILVNIPHSVTAIHADPFRITQVLWNLLGNAIKFTPRGGRVTIAAQNEAEMVHFSVSDTGAGIRPEDRGRVFDRFWQSPETAGKGTGLGLAIAKGIVESHNGQIWLESELGKGTTFHFSIPRAREMVAIGPGSQNTLASTNAVKGRRILVVDDSEDSLLLLSSILRRMGAEVASASSMNEALACFKEKRPDTLITDIEMPQGNGYELLARIRAADGHGSLRAIALTGHANPQESHKMREAGFDAWLTKPLSLPNLLDALG